MSRQIATTTDFSQPFVGEHIALMLNRVLSKKEALESVPAYLFDILLHDGTRIGQIDIRMGATHALVMYGGQIGYGIDKPYRGRGYAVQACELLKGIAKSVDFKEIWITCNPDNVASIKTCERIGAVFIERVDVPQGTELWYRGDREKLRFLWSLE